MKNNLSIILFFLSSVLFFKTASSQSLQLFLEDFNTGNNYFNLNSGGPSPNTGTNLWVVNKQYNGNGTYPNTTSELNTVGGAPITMPNNNYLHIYSHSDSSVVSNCNYNNDSTSDNFAYMNGFCTLGFKDIHFSFFWLCEGSTNDYGTIYYSADFGPWIQCGLTKYNYQSIWAYEDISLPAFNNHANLRFGFRWQNTNSGGTNSEAFGIDDVIVVGTVDNTNPITLKITNVSPTTVCEEGNVTLTWSMSAPLCDGAFQVYMSDDTGSFSAPFSLGGFTISAGDTSGSLQVPLFKIAGNCFKFRIDRTSPPPLLTGVPSTVCLQMTPCASTVTTNQPSVLIGPDTLCDNSVIDIPFNSTGTFNSTNEYIAELSDATGSFANPQMIVSSRDESSYASIPGNLRGLIPVTSQGCNYYIRVVSTSPAYSPPPSAYYGPFCIRQCDITTNNGQDISVCIGDTTGANVPIKVGINSWNKNNVAYTSGNKFLVQLLNNSSPPPHSIINTGGLGMIVSSVDTTTTLHIPGFDSLLNKLGISPGAYYMRFISTNSNSPSDTLGTLVRLTIGYSNPNKPILASYDDATFNLDSVFCSGQIADILVQNDDEYPPFNSKYLWKSAFNFGMQQPFLYGGSIGVNLNAGTSPGKYWFQVQEINNGCLSPWSDTLWITVNTKPSLNTLTNSNICAGPVITFTVPHENDTYYSWRIGGDTAYHIISIQDTILKVVFDSVGFYIVSDTATNQCGSSSISKALHIQHCYGNCNLGISVTVDNATCDTCLNGFAKILISNGVPPFEYTWHIIPTQNIDTLGGLAPGKYVVCVSDARGCSVCDTVTVGAGSCSAKFNLYPDTLPHYYLAQNLASGVPPITYLWHWGDGATSAGPYPSHTYANGGFYSICLDIADSVGCTNHFCSSFNIQRNDNSMVYVSVIPAWATGVTSSKTDYSFSLYPNPASQLVEVKYGTDLSNADIIITDLSGRIVHQEKTNTSGNLVMPLNNITPGAYYLQVIKDDKRLIVRKLVIVK